MVALKLQCEGWKGLSCQAERCKVPGSLQSRECKETLWLEKKGETLEVLWQAKQRLHPTGCTVLGKKCSRDLGQMF